MTQNRIVVLCDETQELVPFVYDRKCRETRLSDKGVKLGNPHVEWNGFGLHESGFVTFDLGHHGCLLIDGLRAIDESHPALLGQGNSHSCA